MRSGSTPDNNILGNLSKALDAYSGKYTFPLFGTPPVSYNNKLFQSSLLFGVRSLQGAVKRWPLLTRGPWTNSIGYTDKGLCFQMGSYTLIDSLGKEFKVSPMIVRIADELTIICYKKDSFPLHYFPDHPYISPNTGTLCMGTVKEAAAKAYKRMDYYSLLSLIEGILSSSLTDSPYRRLETLTGSWPLCLDCLVSHAPSIASCVICTQDACTRVARMSALDDAYICGSCAESGDTRRFCCKVCKRFKYAPKNSRYASMYTCNACRVRKLPVVYLVDDGVANSEPQQANNGQNELESQQPDGLLASVARIQEANSLEETQGAALHLTQPSILAAMASLQEARSLEETQETAFHLARPNQQVVTCYDENSVPITEEELSRLYRLAVNGWPPTPPTHERID